MASVRKRVWTSPSGEEKQAWVVSYTDQAGKRRLITRPTKKEADKERLRIEVEIEKGTHVARRDSMSAGQLMGEWLDQCRRREKAGDRMRASTLRNWECCSRVHIVPTLGAVSLVDLDYRRLQVWIEDLAFGAGDRKPMKRGRLVTVAYCMYAALQFAYQRGWIGSHPLAASPLRIPGEAPPPRDIPTKDDIRSFLEKSDIVIGQGGVARWLRPMLNLAVMTGMRQGEIRGLSWADINLEKGFIRVRRSLQRGGAATDPKSRAGFRDIPIAPRLSTELKRWKLVSGNRGSDFVFSTRDGKSLCETNILESWYRLQYRVRHGRPVPSKEHNRAPREGFRFHDLRHLAASLFIETGLPPKRIQYLMGHASIQMTFDRYGHLFDDPSAVSEAFSRISIDLAS